MKDGTHHFIVVDEHVDITKVNLSDMLDFLTKSVLPPEESVQDYLVECGAVKKSGAPTLIVDNGRSERMAQWEKHNDDIGSKL